MQPLTAFGSLKIILNGLLLRQPPLSNLSLETHLHAAVDWLLHAQRVNRDGGVSASYDLVRGTWAASYPETTGYIIPTLLAYAGRYGRQSVRDAALQMAEYELHVQLADGGFACLQDKNREQVWPVAFDTGQVLFGLLAAYQETGDPRFLISANRAADWLVAHQSPDGFWEDYHSLGSLRSIDTRVSWALLRLWKISGENRYKDSARLQLDWVLQQQLPNGWFLYCTFDPDESPVTHSIAYTMEGLLEAGMILSDDRYILAARKTADELRARVHPTGYLAGSFDRRWRPAVSWSCLTGSAQSACTWLRLAEITGSVGYRQTAESVIRYVAGTQSVDGAPPERYGAISGSWPVFGGYLRLKYPNWAAKFFIDAILKLQTLSLTDH